MRVAVDTNIIVYAERLDDEARANVALELLRAMVGRTIIPVQVLGEAYRVLRRKGRRSALEASEAIARWAEFISPADTTQTAFADALSLSGRHGMDIWDSVILAVAAEAECGLLISEDLQDGFVWRGVTVVNPFAQVLHPLLASTLGVDRL
jgi:predicted nucleic acid-binding protein